MYEEIIYEVEDPIATIKLNRPERLNAWTDRMGAEVKHAFASAEADERVVVIVLTGAGRGFCAGADLKNLQTLSAGTGDGQGGGRPDFSDLAAEPGDPNMDAALHGAYSYPMKVCKPVIAAINGPCAGMAMPISLCCDLRFASDRAVFTTAFSQRGLIAEWGISWSLTRLVGHAHSLDLTLSARRIDAAEAERIGLVNRTLPHDELMPFVYGYAKDLATNCSPASMAVMKRQIYLDMTESLAHTNTEAFRLMLDSFSRPDFKEGVSAFMEKRSPSFQRLKGPQAV
jgi:enoyl-CoA hydratase/carnithine racemase